MTWPNTTSISPGGVQNYTLPVSLSYPTITSEAKTINDGSTEFSNYLQSDNKVFQGFLWFFFVIGLLMGGILIYCNLFIVYKFKIILINKYSDSETTGIHCQHPWNSIHFAFSDGIWCCRILLLPNI